MTSTAPSDSLAALGLDRAPAVHRNDTAPRLYEETIRRGTGRLTAHGALNVDTTPYTGRSPKDKFVVRDASTEGTVAWGSVNQPFDPERYAALASRVREHLASRELWVQDLRAGADPRQTLPIRLVTESPWHALFARSRGRKAPVKAFLMDQTVVVGVGNIYAAESLFLAGIHPGRAAGAVSRERYRRLAGAVKQVLAYSIERGGTTLRDFLSPDGAPGYFEQELQVYGREGEPCRRCTRALRGATMGGRATVWCSHCQR